MIAEHNEIAKPVEGSIFKDMKITDICVFPDGNLDLVVIYTDMPHPFPEYKTSKLQMRFTAPKGKGVAYVKKHFGVELKRG